MIHIKFEPNLSHCIETVAKREYERVLNLLLKGKEEDPWLAEELELLRVFLESADFGQLRSLCDKFLLAGNHVSVRLKSINAAPKYEVEVVEA